MKIEVPDFQSDERGVSPVIGVILMVAITVILAAVIGAFVLDLGSQLGSTGPQTQLTASDASDDIESSDATADELVVVEHKGGDDLAKSETKVMVIKSGGSEYTGATVSGWGSDNTLTVGETLTITEGAEGDFASATTLTVKVVHKPSNSVVTSTKVEVN